MNKATLLIMAAMTAFGESYWGIYTNGVVTRAPTSFNGIINPTSSLYLDAGYKRIVDIPPACSNGYTAVRTSWTNEGVIVTAVYDYVEDPVPVNTYRKSYLAQWLYAHGKWEAFQQVLEGVPDAKFLWSVCTEFDSDNSQWPTFLAYVKMALELSDDDVASMLTFGESGHE